MDLDFEFWTCPKGSSIFNFYISNGGVIAPSYGIETDDEVKEKLQSYLKIKAVF